MKKRTDILLLTTCLLSLAFYVFALPWYLDGLPLDWPEWLFTVCIWLCLGFHGVPAFCLQLLLCRRTPRWVAAIPTVLILGAAACFACCYFNTTGWNNLGFALLLVLSIAPAVGCALGWAVYGGWCLYRKGDIRHV